jgi:hypothetical protein
MNEGDAQQSIGRQGTPEESITPHNRAIRNNAMRKRGNLRLQSDGHPMSSSFQPILDEYALGRFDPLFCRYHVRARTGLVLVNKRGKHHAFPPEVRPTIGELIWKGPGTLYEIDMGLHWTRLELELPSLHEAVPFNAVVDLEWRVVDPVQVVRDGVKDIREALFPRLHHRLSMLTREFSMDETSLVEREALESLTNQPIGEEYGLLIHAFVRMRMEEKVRDVRREIALEHETQVLRLLREESTTNLINIRVERYRAIILAGDYNQFALQLAQNPDEAKAVVKMLHDNRRNVIDFVTHLLDSGAIDRYEINDQVRAALDWLKEATDTVLHPPEQPVKIPSPRAPDAYSLTDMPEVNPPDPQQVDPTLPFESGHGQDTK